MIVLVTATAVFGSAPPALAACHAFTVEAEPTAVGEGAAVTVTVSRDAGVGPSQIDIETIDGSARGGADYEAVARRTVSFSSETEQSFEVPTLDDPESEAAETFSLHLSNPGGCAVNPNFVVGPDVEVTITDNDESDTAAPPISPTTASPPSTATTAPSGSTTTSTTAADPDAGPTVTTGATTTTSELDAEVASSDVDEDGDDDGVPAPAVAAAIVVALAAAGGVAWVWRRRNAAG